MYLLPYGFQLPVLFLTEPCTLLLMLNCLITWKREAHGDGANPKTLDIKAKYCIIELPNE